MSTPETQGKGRPTPKRKDSQRPRTIPTAAPKTRREALARARDLRRESAAESRAAMKSGNIRALPAKERTPERVLARDFIDTRRNLSSFFFPIVVLYFVSSLASRNSRLANALGTLLLMGTLLMVVDAIRIARGLGKLMRERTPDSTARNPWFYAVSRAT